MKSIIHISFLLLASLVTSVAWSSGSAEFRQDVDQFVSDLEKISEIQNFDKISLADYKPWEKPFLLIDRADSLHFVGINLKCPMGWSCKEKNTAGRFKVIEGVAPFVFSTPVNMNFDMFFPKAASSDFFDKSIQKIFEVNQLKTLVSATFPFVQGQIGTLEFSQNLKGFRWLSSYVLIHEGFHLYVQFQSFYGLPTPWKLDFTQFQQAKREDAFYCYDVKLEENVREEDAIIDLWRELETVKNKLDLRYIRNWIALRNERYHALPKIDFTDTKIKSTDCKVLDTLYEKLEGLADYVSLSYLIHANRMTEQDMRGYMDGLFVESPKAVRNPEYHFYFFGLAQAMLLDVFNPSGEWKNRALSEPQTSLTDLLGIYSPLVKGKEK